MLNMEIYELLMKKLKITDIENEPIERISFLTIPPNSIEPSEFSLPIYHGKIKGLPMNINAIVVTSDLQGVIIQNDKNVLLGEFLAENLKLIFEVYFHILKQREQLHFYVEICTQTSQSEDKVEIQ
jgi:hypothetical protein